MSTTTYYDQTAQKYDALHNVEPEHDLAIDLGWRLLGKVDSALDVGAGTGRALLRISQIDPSVSLHGIEPSREMIKLAEERLPKAFLRQGTGESLPYSDGQFDVAVATGIMHHVDDPAKVISEMFRVARKAILISDHNNYAFGGDRARRVRMLLKVCGLLDWATYVKQGFKRQGYSEDDGYWYPYSLLDNYEHIANLSQRLHIIPTRAATGGGNLVFAQSHMAIVALRA